MAAKPATVLALASSTPTTSASSSKPQAIRLLAASIAEKPEMQALEKLWRGPSSCSQSARRLVKEAVARGRSKGAD